MLGDIRDFRPDDHTGLITEVIEVLVVLIMRKANRVLAQLLNQLHILLVHFPGDGVAQPLAVLMAGNAVQRIGAAIEEEAFLGVYPEAPDAHAGGNGVHHFPALLERALHTQPPRDFWRVHSAQMENLCVYFLFRYFKKAVNDRQLLPRVCAFSRRALTGRALIRLL